jgi:hypothetical protein
MEYNNISAALERQSKAIKKIAERVGADVDL